MTGFKQRISDVGITAPPTAPPQPMPNSRLIYSVNSYFTMKKLNNLKSSYTLTF